MNKKLLHFALTTLLLLIFITPPLKGWGQTYTWQKATSIQVGDVVALVYETGSKELSGFTTSGTIYGTGTDYTNVPIGAYPLTVVAGNASDYFAFQNGENYIQWSSGNSLSTKTSIDDNSSWSVTFNDGNAIIANKNNSDRTIQWNTGSPRFACYTSVQAAVQLYKRVSVTTHTLTITQPTEGGTIAVTDADNNPVESGSQIAEGAELTLTATPAAGYEFTQWTATSGDINDDASATTTFTMGTSDAIISASFGQNTTEYSVNVASGITNGTITANPTSCVSGTTVTLTITPATGYHLESLTITDDDDNEIEYTTDYTFTMPASNVTVTATFTNTLTDVLTATLVNQAMSDNSGYQAWSSVTSNSEAVYAGQSNKTASYIQIRNTSPSGIVSTTSGGYVKKVALEWKGSNANNRKITVYGKNTAYDSPVDLYSDDKRGEELGTIVYNTSTELVITGDYMYVGLKSDGAAYFDPLSITWQPVTKYNVTCSHTGTDGTIAADPTSAPEGATVTLTATPADHYNLVSWTVLHGDAQTVTVAPVATDPNKATFTMPASNVEVDASFVEDTKYTITIAAEIEDYVTTDAPQGNVAYEGEKLTINVTAPTGKVLETLSIKDADDNNVEFAPEVSAANDVYYFEMPASDITISATFKTAVTYTVAYSVNGTASTPEQVDEGTEVTLPATATTPEGFSFAGWTTDANDVSNILAASSQYTVSAAVVFYAVYGRTIEGTSTTSYQKVTSTADITDGQYLIVYETDNVAFDGSLETLDAVSNTIEVTITEGVIASNENTNAAAFTIAAIENTTNYSIKSASGNYIGKTSGGNGMDANANTVYSNSISVENGNVAITASGGSTLKFNDASNQNRFRYYGSGQKAIQLYKKTTVTPSTTTYYTRVFDEVATADISIVGPSVIPTGATLDMGSHTLTNTLGADNLIIEDGGQLKISNTVNGTVLKNITGYSSYTGTGNGGYYLIATPATLDATNQTNMFPSVASDHQYVDFYGFDQTMVAQEWRNYKYGNESFAGPLGMEQGQGYLYASKDDVTLTLKTIGLGGNINNNYVHTDYPFVPTNADKIVEVSYNAEGINEQEVVFKGYNLIGNPFTCKAYLADGRDFYRMNEAGDKIVVATDKAINVAEGIFVIAESGETSVTFTTTDPTVTSTGGVLNITLSQAQSNRGNAATIDAARIRFGEGRMLPKFNFMGNNGGISIPQGSKDYAVVRSQGEGELPVNFKADKNGAYTLSIRPENVEMDYLHLIDNLTGTEVDLLATPTYTFNAKKTDYASRFRLVFSTTGVEENGTETNASFAFFNGSEWVVNADDNATLEVIDMMGRIVAHGTRSVGTDGMAQGVYVLRLVDGNSVKTQKIVVR